MNKGDVTQRESIMLDSHYKYNVVIHKLAVCCCQFQDLIYLITKANGEPFLLVIPDLIIAFYVGFFGL